MIINRIHETQNLVTGACLLPCRAKDISAPGPDGSKRLRFPAFIDSRHVKVVRLSAQHTGRPYLPADTPGTHFCKRLSRPQSHSAVGRINSMKKSQSPHREFNPRPYPTSAPNLNTIHRLQMM